MILLQKYSTSISTRILCRQIAVCKICAAGSPMGWNCPVCLNGNLASPTLRPASPRPFSPAPPPPTPPHLLAQISGIHLCLSPHILPSLTPTLLPPSPYLPHHHRPQVHSRPIPCHPTLKEIHAPHKLFVFFNGMPAVFLPPAVPNWSLFSLATTMTSFSSRKLIFPQPKSSKSLVIIPFARTGHSVDKALFPPVLITLVVVSSLSSTLTWLSLLFLSSLCLPRTFYDLC